jgi:translocation and assembly module TamB
MKLSASKIIALILLVLSIGAGLVISGKAQDSDADEKSTFVRFVENQISSENFRIGLNGLEGTLSSDVRMSSITISDADGVWLTISQPRMVWSRTALLTGTLQIDSLTAESIIHERNPLPDESLPDPESSGFALPELPVAVTLEKLDIPKVSFGEAVFGLESEASVKGAFKLAEGALDLDLDITRLDGPGGELKALATYDGNNKNLKLDVRLNEPANGMIANALNIEGQPPVALTIAGDAPVEELEVSLGFDVAAKRILSGNLALSKENEALAARATLSGPLADILPPQHQAFFGNNSDLNALLLFEESGAINLQSLTLESGSVGLNAQAYRLADGFLKALDAQLILKPNGTERILLPIAGEDTSLASLDMTINYDASRSSDWDVNIEAASIRQNDISIPILDLEARGSLVNFNQPDRRETSFEIFGKIDGFDSEDAGLKEAVGDQVRLYATGNWKSAAPTQISALRVNAKTFDLTSSGTLDKLEYTGTTTLASGDLTAFSRIAERSLAGKANIRTAGKYALLSNSFDLTLEGTTNKLSLGDPVADRLFDGITNMKGSLSRNENGLAFKNLRISNNQLETGLDGRFASEEANLSGNALIRNLQTLSENATGPVELTIDVSGSNKPVSINSTIAMPKGALQGRKVNGLRLSFEGVTDGKTLDGNFEGDGEIGNKPVSITAELETSKDSIRLGALNARVTDTTIRGYLTRFGNGLLDGRFDVASSDIGDVAALGLVDAGGEINGTVELSDEETMQTVKTDLSVSRLRYEDYRVKSGTLVATALDVFNQPRIGATLNGETIRAGGTTIDTVDARISTIGNETTFETEAFLSQNNANLKASGKVLQQDQRSTVQLETLVLSSDVANANLTKPASIILSNGTTRISDAVLAVGSGEIRVDGSSGEELNLLVDISALPASIVNTFAPDVRAGGNVSGSIRVSGKTNSPNARFELNGSEMTAAPLREAGVSPLSVTARGSYEGDNVRLEALQLKNAQNVSVSTTGSISIKGSGLDLQARGTVPLALASASVADRGASIVGNAGFDVRITGNLNAPDARGSVRISDASYTDPLANLRLTGISLQANLAGKQVIIESGQARLGSGGSVRMGGSVSLADNLPANIDITLANASYTDGETFSTSASGRLRLEGTLLRDPILSGNISLGKTEITVPESFAGDATLLDVKHVRPDAKTRQTLARRNQATPAPSPTARPSILRLDVTVNAPNQIFVRGRGLDAELGGNIRVQGPVSNVQPIGQFELRRGRLSILGKRIDLTEGTISLTGDLDPVVNFVAQTSAQDVEAYIIIKGRISDVDVSFTSSPELPQDEVLALIIFGRGINDLSPVQIARLAAIAAELTGGNSPGLVDGIRRGAGLDDLDVVEDDDGNAAVRAGKYVSDNVYLGVEAGQKNTEATVNLDITDNLTARGGVSSDGETSLGIFLEKDY